LAGPARPRPECRRAKEAGNPEVGDKNSQKGKKKTGIYLILAISPEGRLPLEGRDMHEQAKKRARRILSQSHVAT
jgi:hypothetical protein